MQQKFRSAIARSPAWKLGDLVQETPLLGVGVFTRNNVEDQSQLRIEQRQRVAWQRRAIRHTRFGDAMLRRGQVIAIEDLDAITRKLGRQFRAMP